jgi:hypothetical protein
LEASPILQPTKATSCMNERPELRHVIAQWTPLSPHRSPCVWGGSKSALISLGHDVIWAGDWPEDPGDDALLSRADAPENPNTG